MATKWIVAGAAVMAALTPAKPAAAQDVSKIDWDEAVNCFLTKVADIHDACPGNTGSLTGYLSWRNDPPEVVNRARDILESIAITSDSENARSAAIIALVVWGDDRPESETLERLQRIYRASTFPATRSDVIRQAPEDIDPAGFSRLMEMAVRDTRPSDTRDVVAVSALRKLMHVEAEEVLSRLKEDVESLPNGRVKQVLRELRDDPGARLRYGEPRSAIPF